MITVNVSSDEDQMTVGELLNAALHKCEKPLAASAEEAREVDEDPLAEAEKKKQDIASGKKPADEEVQAYFDNQDQQLKNLERAQRESIVSLHDQQRRMEEVASGDTSSVPVTATDVQRRKDDEQLTESISTVLHE